MQEWLKINVTQPIVPHCSNDAQHAKVLDFFIA
jgi:hypothetical protein